MRLESILNKHDVAIRQEDQDQVITMVTKNSLGQIVYRKVKFSTIWSGDEHDSSEIIRKLARLDDWEDYGDQSWWEQIIR
jgi:hypothetical protein